MVEIQATTFYMPKEGYGPKASTIPYEKDPNADDGWKLIDLLPIPDDFGKGYAGKIYYPESLNEVRVGWLAPVFEGFDSDKTMEWWEQNLGLAGRESRTG